MNMTFMCQAFVLCLWFMTSLPLPANGQETSVKQGGDGGAEYSKCAQVYLLQAASFRSVEQAVTFCNSLEAKGYSSSVVVLYDTRNIPWYITAVGTFPNREQAMAAADAYTTRTGGECFVKVFQAGLLRTRRIYSSASVPPVDTGTKWRDAVNAVNFGGGANSVPAEGLVTAGSGDDPNTPAGAERAPALSGRSEKNPELEAAPHPAPLFSCIPKGAGDTVYLVQTGSFRDAKDADRMRSRLEAGGLHSIIYILYDAAHRPWYAVLAGVGASRKEAPNIGEHYSRKFAANYVIRPFRSEALIHRWYNPKASTGVGSRWADDDLSLLAQLSATIMMNPRQFEARMNRARLCFRLKLLNQGLADLNAAIAIEPASAEAHYQRAQVLLRLGRPKDALGDFLKAHQLDCRYPNPVLHSNRCAPPLKS